MKKLLSVMALSAMVCGAVELRMECKDMARDDEKWACSTSGVLVAKDKNVIASGTYAIPAAGKYFIWVNTETRNEGWRKAQIKINGISFGKFGDDKLKDFTQPTGYWKKMMLPLEVKSAGEVIKVEIVAISSTARVSKVVLSDNPEFNPSAMSTADVVDASEELENAE